MFLFSSVVFLGIYTSFIDDSSIITGNSPCTHAVLDHMKEEVDPLNYAQLTRFRGACSARGTQSLQSREVASTPPGQDPVTKSED